jgi:acetyl-CoA carboxylase carboxyltransferase component
MHRLAVVPQRSDEAESEPCPPTNRVTFANAPHAANTPSATPMERLAILFDRGEFQPIDALVQHQSHAWGMQSRKRAGDGVVIASGRVHGKPAFAFAQDRSFLGGSLGEAHARKICKAMDLAATANAPILGLLDSGGARVQEGVAALAGYGEIFRRNVHLSGRVPQISVVLGPCAGGAAYSPSITDFIVFSRADALMFITGPRVVKQAMFEDVDAPTLGGARVHAERTGVAHVVREDAVGAIDAARDLLAYVATPHAAPREPEDGPSLEAIVPINPRTIYDVRKVVRRVVDAGSFLEIQPDFAKNVVVGLARVAGRSIGIVANQPREKAGVLDITASRKAARFVRTMSAFGVPIVSLVDVPGFLPGTAQEHGAIITHGAKLLYAYCEARVPRITVVMRKAFGGAYIVMGSKHVGTDVNLAWPNAQIAVMGAEPAIELLHGKEISAHADPKARTRELCDRYTEELMTVRASAERGWIDDVIAPDDTRAKIAWYLSLLERAPRGEQHGNVPL